MSSMAHQFSGVNISRYITRKAHEWYEISKAEGLALDRKANLQKIAHNLRELQRGLTGDRARVGSGYMDEKSVLQAYLLYYWPVSFYETMAVLVELAQRNALPKIRSILDIGSGPGPATFAASLFGAKLSVLVDASQAALDEASKIAQRARQGNQSIEIVGRQANLQTFKPGKDETYDLIIASHSVNELWHGEHDWLERRRDFFLSLLPSLSKEGLLLIIEPSAHYTSIPLLELRDSLLTVSSGLSCVGPCPHSRPCPMRAIEGRPCFSEWLWNAPALVKQLAELAGLDRASLKASWVAFRNNYIKKETSIPGQTDNFSSQRSLASPQAPASIAGRIVSQPMLNKAGRIRFILCTEGGHSIESGQLATISMPEDALATKRAGAGNSEFMRFARGDIIEACCLETRAPNHFGIVSNTQLRFIMKVPRF